MSLTLYYHPLSSFCWKALIALYEGDIAFTPTIVDLGDPASRAAFLAVWPIGKFPAIRDDARGHTVAESSALIEYLAQNHAGAAHLIPADPDLAWQVRMRDEVIDNYIHVPMQKIVGDRFRPDDGHDPVGLDQARGQIRQAYDYLEPLMAGGGWAVGEAFTLADCAAFPALYYGNRVEPIGDRPNLTAYLARLTARPSVARTLAEAEPYFHMFPG